MISQVQRAIALYLLRGVVLGTPVLTGRARGNWQTDVNKSNTAELDELDRTGESTIAKGNAVIGRLKPFQALHLFNNLSYIEALENGHSKQAAKGQIIAANIQRAKHLLGAL
jgi:hypothetical protein